MSDDEDNRAAEITATEQKVLRAICVSSGTLGVAASVITELLGVGRETLGTASKRLESKGLCTRERVGARVYLRPTRAGLDFLSARSSMKPRPELPVPRDSDARADAAVSALLTASQAEILAAVARAADRSATSRLVELTGLSNRAVHRQASRLYLRGFLSRRREDRRWFWGLTQNGRLYLLGTSGDRRP